MSDVSRQFHLVSNELTSQAAGQTATFTSELGGIVLQMRTAFDQVVKAVREERIDRIGADVGLTSLVSRSSVVIENPF